MWGADVMAGSGEDSPQDLQKWQTLDNDPGILALEYMKYGDLYGLINKAARAGVAVPDMILWKIFFCRKFQLVYPWMADLIRIKH